MAPSSLFVNFGFLIALSLCECRIRYNLMPSRLNILWKISISDVFHSSFWHCGSLILVLRPGYCFNTSCFLLSFCWSASTHWCYNLIIFFTLFIFKYFYFQFLISFLILFLIQVTCFYTFFNFLRALQYFLLQQLLYFLVLMGVKSSYIPVSTIIQGSFLILFLFPLIFSPV